MKLNVAVEQEVMVDGTMACLYRPMPNSLLGAYLPIFKEFKSALGKTTSWQIARLNYLKETMPREWEALTIELLKTGKMKEDDVDRAMGGLILSYASRMVFEEIFQLRGNDGTGSINLDILNQLLTDEYNDKHGDGAGKRAAAMNERLVHYPEYESVQFYIRNYTGSGAQVFLYPNIHHIEF